MEAEKKDRIIVLCVDRDNDLGKKAGVAGPIIGREDVIDAATKLGVKDPADTDFNAMFEAVRVYDELKKKHDVEIAVLTGDREVGIKSDKEVSEQLEKVLKHFRGNLAVLISDGTEDEHVMPVIQSRIPILSVKRVVVKQSERLESSYYKVKDFVTESLENPKMSKLVFGLPAVALILIAVFGAEGWRAVIGILGAYLIIKGFKLEGYIYSAVAELRDTFSAKRFAFFMYMLGIIFVSLAAYRGYTVMSEWMVMGLFEMTAAFLSASVYYFWLGGTLVWVGRSVTKKKRTPKKIASIPVFGFAVAIVVHSGTDLILTPASPIVNFILTIVGGFILMFAAFYIEKK